MMSRLFNFLSVVIVKCRKAQIFTCAGCKLNRLPELRQFVFDEVNGATSFDGVSLKFTSGHNPDLIIYSDDGSVEETIDMAPLGLNDLNEILLSRGFVKKKTEL